MISEYSEDHNVNLELIFQGEENEEELNPYVKDGYETKLTRDLGDILSI
jgi:hypothetical protein